MGYIIFWGALIGLCIVFPPLILVILIFVGLSLINN